MSTARRRPTTSSGRRPGWQRVALPVAVAVLLPFVGQATPASAAATDPASSTVVLGLLQLGAAIGGAAELPPLSEDLPLTDVSVRDVLGLDTVVGRAVADAVRDKDYANLDQMAAVVSASPSLDLVAAAPGPAGERQWTLSLDVTTESPVPLRYQDDRLQTGAAEATGELAGRLTGSLLVRYDPAAVPLRQFSVVGDQALTARAWTRPADSTALTATRLPVPAFPLVDGFVELSGAGTLQVDSTTAVRLRDSNGRGGVTAEDLQFGSSEDLFTVDELPAADAVQADLELTTDLLSTARGRLSVTRPARPSAALPSAASPSGASYGTVAVTRDAALDRIGSLTRPQAFAAFAQYASAVVAAETAVDADLPLLEARVTDLYSPGQRLLDIVTRQAAARVVCGAAPTSPPSGAARPGQARYCQALTDGTAPDSGSVRWSTDDGVLSGATTDGTVGSAPGAHVTLRGGGGFPRLTVSWTVAGEPRTASTLLVSVQDLGRVLRAEGFTVTPAYDPASEAFELPVSEALGSRSVVVPTGGATSLTPLTGLTGLCPADPTSTSGSGPRRCARPADADPATTGTLAVGDSSFTGTLGIALPVAGSSDTAAAVAYVRPGTAGQLWKVGTVAADVGQAKLSGRIGFLAVDVDVTAYSLVSGAAGAARITLPTSSLRLPSGRTAAGVTALNDLLGVDGGAVTVRPTGTRGLTATATLAVRDGADAAGTRPLGDAGVISAVYRDLSDGVLPAVTTDDGYAKLRRLDLRPSVRGVAAEGSGADVLVASADAGIDLARDFGIDLTTATTSADRVVQKTLYDLDAVERGVCTAFRVLSPVSLQCVAGPLADRVGAPKTATSPAVPVVSFVPGHRFLVDGDPTALRDVLLDQLAEVLAVYSTPDPALGLERTLPLLDVRPEQLDVARIALGDALATLTAAAGDDDGRTTATSAGPEVSTLQGFGTALRRELPTGAVAKLELEGQQLRLVTDVTAADPAAAAPLRIATGDTLLRVVGLPGADGVPAAVAVPLDATSSARVELAVDLKAGTALVGRGTAVTQQVTGVRSAAAAVAALLDGKTAEQGDVSTPVVGNGGAATGTATLDIGVLVRTAPRAGTPDWQEIGALRASLASARTAVGTADCGYTVPAGAAACVRLPLASAGSTAASTVATDVVKVSLGADDSSGGDAKPVVRPLAYRFLADPLPALSRTLRDALDGGITGDSLPFVGADLDGADDVPTAVAAFGAAARKQLALVDVAETAPISALTGALATAINGVTVGGVSRKAPVVVTATCAGVCAATATVASIRELRAPIELTGGVTDKTAPFQAGPQGLPLKSDLEVPTTTVWRLPVTLGILRGTGPFLALGTEATVPVLELTTLDARLPDYAAARCHDWARGRGAYAALPAQATGRCLDALVGYLPSVLVDKAAATGTGPTSKLDAALTVRVTPGAGTADGPADKDGRVFLPALFDKQLPSSTDFTGTGVLDLFFEGFATEIGFFDVLGTLDLRWAGATGYAADIAYGDLRLDAKGVYDLLDSGYGQVKDALEPLDIVVDVLTTPVPGIDQVSKLTGGPSITLLDILAKLDPRVQLVVKLIEFQQLFSNLPGGSGTELLSLGDEKGGRFQLGVNAVQYNKCTSTVASRASSASNALKVRASNTVQLGQTAGVKSVGLGSGGRCNGLPLPKAKAALKSLKQKLTKTAPVDPYKGAPATTQDVKKKLTKSVYVSLPAISIPVLEDADQVMDLLLGQGDSTLLRVDLGKIGASATLARSFGPFFAGPVPLMIQVSGKVALDGRFAVAFDTHGLTSRIDALDSPGDVATLTKGDRASRGSVFSDGFYIEDVTAEGVDTPEIQLTFTASLGAGIFLTIFEAGVRGGVVIDLTLDAFDPDEDGKVRIDEFVGRGGGSCPFDVSSGIEFFLAVFLYIDLTIYTLDKSFDIVRSPRLPLFSLQCARTTPVLAVYDAAAAGGPTLTLTTGAKASLRGAFPDVTKEAYSVSALGAALQPTSDGSPGSPKTGAGGVPLQRVEVEAFDLSATFDVLPTTRVVADAGAGDDVLKFVPGNTVVEAEGGGTLVQPVPFTLRVDADGEDGADKVVSADGADTVDGGAGDDVLETGVGDDVVGADAGDDSVDAGPGQDIVSGGAGADRLAGGPGADEVRGDAGDDVLEGGLGADPASLFASDEPAVIAAQLDGGDLLVGGPGSDVMTGGQGSDVVVGGQYDGGRPAVGSMTTTVDAVNPVGDLVEVRVTSPTLVPPSDETVRAQCAVAGAGEGTDVDDVSGGPARDAVVGGGGNDLLSGGAGPDLVCGRGGDDVVLGDGADVAAADQAADELLGGPGRDRLTGDGGNDRMSGDDGADQLKAGLGADVLDGGLGTDVLLGEQGDDALTGDGDAPATGQGSGRAVVCRETTGVVSGRVDLDGDLVGGDRDDGLLDGLEVVDGIVRSAGAAFTGTLAGTVVRGGLVDLDGDGRDSAADTGALPVAGLVGATGEGDCLLGGEGADTLAGGAGGDLLDGGDAADVVRGGGDGDLARGGADDDDVDGGLGDDLVVGDSGDDLLSGAAGADVLRGGAGADLLRGGSGTANAADGGDELLGDRGADVLTGGNATLVRTATPGTAVPGRTVRLLDTPQTSGPDDQLFGGFGDDWAFGQGGDDLVRGGHDQDVVEGGPGADRVQGDDGDDLAVGGSSTAAEVSVGRTGTGLADGPDTVLGDGGPDGLDGVDVLAGGNALLDRTSGGPGPGAPWTGVGVVLFDEGGAGQDDVLSGGGERDLLLGQGGADTLSGGSGDDALEGGEGDDRLAGDAGDDVLTGDASSGDGVIDADRDGAGRRTGADVLDGGDGDDVLAGDGARLRRDAGKRTDVTLFDVQVGPVASGGSDTLTGGPGSDLLLGQGADDTVLGGAGDDVLEGGPGEDLLGGGGGADDLLGGSSSRTGRLVDGTTDRLLVAPSAPLTVTAPDASAAGVADGRDVLYGDAAPGVDLVADGLPGPDVLLGDNGRITRNGTTVPDQPLRPVRIVSMADVTAGATSGNDVLDGQGGDDDLYGQLDDVAPAAREQQVGTPTVGTGAPARLDVAGDLLRGGPGADLLVGDQATAVQRAAGDLGAPTTLRSNGGFLVEAVRAAGTIVPQVTLTQPGVGGSDVLLGGTGRDTVHAGAGADLADGGADEDVLFGAVGDDALWGGEAHDRVFGGAGDDALDLKVRATDPVSWRAVAPLEDRDGRVDTVNGLDLLSGGRGADRLQADTGDAGQTPGDRLVDWTGVHNLYMVCGGAYGAGRIIDRADPATVALLTELARSTGSVGDEEISLPANGEETSKHPLAPGNFTCEG